MQQIEHSLRRLQTDRLDLYFVHSLDANMPMEETLRAMDDLVRQGKILYPAVSNWAAWQITKALGISERHHWARFECIQPMYSLLKRQVEVEILPLAQSEQVGVISYSPLGGGILSGKYGSKLPDRNRFLANPSYLRRYSDPMHQDITARFLEHAEILNIHPATLAVAWVMAHPGITAPIIGARNVEQLETSLAAADIKLDAEQYAEISALSYDPPSPTDRSEERK
jgi:aryl-alcohol dehydrogenase-like predicted oxidoreductase